MSRPCANRNGPDAINLREVNHTTHVDYTTSQACLPNANYQRGVLL